MLRKFVSETGKDWDKWLPYLLFAYREVPQASTGFSPFELLYAHQVRGLLDMLRESWEEADAPGGLNVVSFVLRMRDQLMKTAALARENLLQSQRRQKDWYDRSARTQSFEPGDEVLLLLPKTENKLLAKWQGPYQIKQRMGPVTYEIHIPEWRQSLQTFHVNLLKKWHARPALNNPTNQVLYIRALEEEE